MVFFDKDMHQCQYMNDNPPVERDTIHEKVPLTQSPKKLVIVAICGIGVGLVIFFVGFSRAYLGVHSFDQILYGWTYGLWLAFFLFHYFRPFF